MTLKIRRILYILFIIAFLIITPLVSLYATGYKLNIKNIREGKLAVEKTGMLIIDSEPREAEIFLNQERYNPFLKKYFSEEKHFTTPAKIKSLLPGEYDVRLELEGYLPWEKKLSVLPGASTYAEDIYLFKSNLPYLLKNEVTKIKNISATKKYLTLINNNDINIYNLEAEADGLLLPKLATSTSVSSTTELVDKEVSWAQNDNKLVAGTYVINLFSEDDTLNLNEFVSGDVLKIQWDKQYSNILYYATDNTINQYNFTTKENKSIISPQPFVDFLVRGSNVFLTNQIGKSTNLSVYTKDSDQLLASLNLPFSSCYTFINLEHNLVNLYDKDHQILYLIDPFLSINPLRETISNVKFTQWVNNNKLLYANEFEVWIYDLDKHSRTLLTRISQEIKKIIWHPSNNYVIYATNQSLNIIELDDREKRNISELLSLDEIGQPYLGNNGNALYFFAKIGNQSGLYKLTIQ